MKILKVWLLAFGLSISFFTQAQVLTLAIEPTYPQSQLQTVFQPLCAWVKEKTGYELRLVSSQNYYYYWKDTHHKKPDLSFDAPHVAAHRIDVHGYQPLVKAAHPMVFHLVTDTETEAPELGYFVDKTIATVQKPSMASIFYEQWFEQTEVKPRKAFAQAGWTDAILAMEADRAHAAIVPDWLLQDNPHLVSVKQSQSLPGMSILASPDLDPAVAQHIGQALQNLRNTAPELLQQMNIDSFVPAYAEEFEGLSELIPQEFLSEESRMKQPRSSLNGL